jgi:hypothetical protein
MNENSRYHAVFFLFVFKNDLFFTYFQEVINLNFYGLYVAGKIFDFTVWRIVFEKNPKQNCSLISLNIWPLCIIPVLLS